MLDWQNAFVRDLAWVISSACIIKHRSIPAKKFFSDEYQNFLPNLINLDKNPAELVAHLEKAKRKALGNYFEDLIEFWLQRRPNTKILARNLQIIDDKKTIGECDFIIEIDGIITHLEVAIKYYIAIQNSSKHEFWVGRGLTDRLDKKFDKLFKQQLELSNSIIMTRQLQQQNIPSIDAKMAFVKGFFFKHYFTTNHALPEHAPNGIEESFWCNISEANSLPENLAYWQILNKPHWLTHDDEYFPRKELVARAQDYFDNVKNTPVLLNALSDKRNAKVVKFFMAPSSLAAFRP